MGNFIKAPPSQAAVISGCRGTRLAVGSTAWSWWFIEEVNVLSLELYTLQLVSTDAETCRGVRVNVTSTAQVKVAAILPEASGAPAIAKKSSNMMNMIWDRKQIMLASQHFLGQEESQIVDALKRTLEGHQRQILGTLTVEELFKDRGAFSSRIREHVFDDLAAMGFKIVSYTVTKIDDDLGYMESLGATQTALVKRQAAEGTAKNEAEAQKKVAEYKADADLASAFAIREAHVGVNTQKTLEAESDQHLNLKKAEFDKKVNEAQAVARAALLIEDARQNQKVVEERTKQKYVQMSVEGDIADKEAEKIQKEKAGLSKALLMQRTNEAEAVRVYAKAEADTLTLMANARAGETEAMGKADANAILAKGRAEAEVMREKAAAYELYGEAAITEMVVTSLPKIASEIAAPLSKAGNITMVSNDGAGPSQLTSDMARMVSQVPAIVEGLTGFDMSRNLKSRSGAAVL